MKTTDLTPLPQYSAGTQPLPPRWPAWEHILSRLALGLCLAALLLLSVGVVSVGAPFSVPHTARTSHAVFRATHVFLHGRAAPTISCLDGHKGSVRSIPLGGSGPLAHLVYPTYCDDDALFLYDGSSNVLCINGAGILNLTDVGWNDRAVGYWTGCYYDIFATDLNMHGDWLGAPGSYDGEGTNYQRLPYQGFWDHTMSSLWQDDSYGGDECPI